MRVELKAAQIGGLLEDASRNGGIIVMSMSARPVTPMCEVPAGRRTGRGHGRQVAQHSSSEPGVGVHELHRHCTTHAPSSPALILGFALPSEYELTTAIGLLAEAIC
jgi:hypothetical protein